MHMSNAVDPVSLIYTSKTSTRSKKSAENMSAATTRSIGCRKGKLHLYRRAVGTFDRRVDKIPIDKVTQPCIEARERFCQGAV
jgi:hypothetical protein